MANLMRCLFCGLLQDEPGGAKTCLRCGGELAFETLEKRYQQGSYLDVQMEVDQINAPSDQTVDRHLLITLRTPAEVPQEHKAPSTSGRPPLSFTAVVDVSGSMHGMKIVNTKQALKMAAQMLREGDQMAMVVFSSEAKLVMKPVQVTRENLSNWGSLVEELQPGGMTALHEGLELGITQARKMRSENNLTLLLSDGEANVGETNLEVIGQTAKTAADQGSIISTLGVGMDYNEALMTEIANQGRGRFYHVQEPGQIISSLTGELGEAANVAARDVKIHLHLPKGAALIPLSSFYTCEIKQNLATVSVGDIPIDLEMEIPLRLTLYAGKADTRLSIAGEVTYRSPGNADLQTHLNQVAVRFVKKQDFAFTSGVVKPVASRIAEQMQAAQVLHYSRAAQIGDPVELKTVENEQAKLRQYAQLLEHDEKHKLLSQLDANVDILRSASPDAKKVMNQAFMTSRSMRGRK
jgi:Ca-activated chloride channel homolog